MVEGIHQLVARERHGEHLDDAHALACLDRLLGNGDDDDGDADAGLADPFGDLQAVDLALQQGIHHQRVWSQLTDLVHDHAAVGDGIEQADLLLMLEEIAHILRHLRDVFDQ